MRNESVCSIFIPAHGSGLQFYIYIYFDYFLIRDVLAPQIGVGNNGHADDFDILLLMLL